MIFGSVRDVIPLQPWNALFPTLVNVCGRVTKVRLRHPSHVLGAIISTPSGTTTLRTLDVSTRNPTTVPLSIFNTDCFVAIVWRLPRQCNDWC